MPATKQSQAVSLANELIGLAGQLQNVNFTSSNLSQRYGNQGTQAILNSLPTCALNADGTLGMADVAPVPGNPIDTRVVTGLNRACTAQNLIAVKNIMNEFIAFMGNATVVTKDRTNATDVILGG